MVGGQKRKAPPRDSSQPPPENQAQMASRRPTRTSQTSTSVQDSQAMEPATKKPRTASTPLDEGALSNDTEFRPKASSNQVSPSLKDEDRMALDSVDGTDRSELDMECDDSDFFEQDTRKPTKKLRQGKARSSAKERPSKAMKRITQPNVENQVTGGLINTTTDESQPTAKKSTQVRNRAAIADDKGRQSVEQEKHQAESEIEFDSESESDSEAEDESGTGSGSNTESELKIPDFKPAVMENLKPLSKPDEIFQDMTKNAMANGLDEAVKHLRGKVLNFATMCSGTESPLLAMEEVREALRKDHGTDLLFKHCFSAEIVAFKQAYIERNFHPDYIFRDVRELPFKAKAATAYGAPADVPTDIDILVAGFSCVDFSRLNKWNKKLLEGGESGDTFWAIQKYAKAYRPAMIVLENVGTAPWELIKGIWENSPTQVAAISEKERKASKMGKNQNQNANEKELEGVWDCPNDPAYSAMSMKLDTKHYYIPHTRVRGYMFLISNRSIDLNAAQTAVARWKSLMVMLRRPASSSVEAFILKDDDPRVLRARDEFIKTARGEAKPRREVDWTLCEARHQDYRASEHLGTGRPITHWVSGGTSMAWDYYWSEYFAVQTERVWDTVDCSFLRNAVRGFDSTCKTRVWELSQNIDRFTDSTSFGVSNCVTPTGMPFLTTRGGPISGLECLSLQGLPINKLLLTRETQSQLQDLAGNAMTTTVVGASILAGLTVAFTAVKDRPEVPKAIQMGPDFIEMDQSHLLEPRVLPMTPVKSTSTQELIKLGQASIHFCYCEGQTSTAEAPIVICQDCGHTSCERCGKLPLHNYSRLNPETVEPRLDSSNFHRLIKDALPMRLIFDGLNTAVLEDFASQATNKDDWATYFTAIEPAFGKELQFMNSKCSHCWSIFYESSSSRLELVLQDGKAQWRLFAKPDPEEPGNSRARKLLKFPFARMTVSSENILEGFWEFCVPNTQIFRITINGEGELIPSWDASLGLTHSTISSKRVWTSLRITAKTLPSNIENDVTGKYQLFRNCGTGMASLHKKTSPVQNGQPPLFLFLDPERIGLPENDQFVFATNKHRLNYEDVRLSVARLESYWRPSERQSSEAECSVYGKWVRCSGASLRPYEGVGLVKSRVPTPDLSLNILNGAPREMSGSSDSSLDCAQATIALLSCEVPLSTDQSLGWRQSGLTTTSQDNERETFSDTAWLTERVRDLGGFSDRWRELIVPAGFTSCETCSPDPPLIKWTKVKNKLIPYEEGKSAGSYERAIKARPNAFVIQTQVDSDNRGHLSVGLNVLTMAHRVLAKVPPGARGLELSWRLRTSYVPPSKNSFPLFTLKDNKDGAESSHILPNENNTQLRKEQRRSLSWMIRQEAEKPAPFLLQETDEATFSMLNWLNELRARYPVEIRGGVLADEVGYGKTVTTLALIDHQMQRARDFAQTGCAGYIPLKATLIIVPDHLVMQWASQVDKFLGKNYVVLKLPNMTTLSSKTVAHFREADIIIVSWKLFNSPSYWRKMAALAALPEGPNAGGRAFDVWLTKANAELEKHVDQMKTNDFKSFTNSLKAKLEAAENDVELQFEIPTARLRGMKYKAEKERKVNAAAAEQKSAAVKGKGAAANQKATANKKKVPSTRKKRTKASREDSGSDQEGRPVDVSKLKKSDKNFFNHLTQSSSMETIKSPAFQMFKFYRIVVDEFTYIDDKIYSNIASLRAVCRWVLSGTPPLDDFADIHVIAGLVGINLGEGYAAQGVNKELNNNKLRKERTAVETFLSFAVAHTPAWHMLRHEHGQAFLDQFVRQNTAETDEIRAQEILCVVKFKAAEKVVFMELLQQLLTQDMKVVKAGKAKNDSDRVKRIKDLLNGSQSPEEALLKCCSYFGISTSCADLVKVREQESRNLLAELETTLKQGALLRRLCPDRDKVKNDTHYKSWLATVKSGNLGDRKAQRILVYLHDSAESNCDDSHEDIFYQDAQEPKTPASASDDEPEDDVAGEDEHYERENSDDEEVVEEEIVEEKEVEEERVEEKEVEENVVAEGIAEEETVEDKGDEFEPDLRPYKINHDDRDALILALRQLVGKLRGLSNEYVARVRALRWLKAVLAFQKWYKDPSGARTCRNCRRDALRPDQISVLGPCGHLACEECLEGREDKSRCIVNYCNVSTSPHLITLAKDLCDDSDDTGDSEHVAKYGSKLGEIMNLINSFPKDDQVLLFVQFEDLMERFANAFEEVGISCHALTLKDSKNSGRMMTDFQNTLNPNTKKRVLLLNSSNELAAGANLTNANRLIFVSPLLAPSQHHYDASLRQCVGRSRRYGQLQTVYIYKFLVLNTVDVDVLQTREGKRLVKREVSRDFGRSRAQVTAEWSKPEWSMCAESKMTGEEREQDWGSGFGQNT